MESGRLVILSGPSGVGKDTVIEAWRAANPRVERVVATTTRPARLGETPGVDYEFATEDEFMLAAEANEFLEYKLVHGNYYGTPRKEVARLIAANRIAVLKIDVQGAVAVMEEVPDVLSVFLLPPNADELERRLRERNTDSGESLVQRLRNAQTELGFAHRYSYRIINDEVDHVVEILERLVTDKEE